VLDAGLLSRLQESLGTGLRRSEQSKGIGDLARLILVDRRRIMRLGEHEARFPQSAKIRRARVVEESLAGSKPAPHPVHSDTGVGAETEGRHEHDREAGERAAGPPGAI
jgi:hypothetical protein